MIFCDFDNDAMTCAGCGFKANDRTTAKNCHAPGKPRRYGPGTHLKMLLASRGQHAKLATNKTSCGCDELANQMDSWGQMVGEHREEILEQLNAARSEMTWLEILTAAVTGNDEFIPNPLHADGLAGAFLDEAIRRANAELTS